MDRVAILVEQRDHMLRQARALENKVAGLDIAIGIVAEYVKDQPASLPAE